MTDMTSIAAAAPAPAAPAPRASRAVLGALVAAATLLWWLATSEDGQILGMLGYHAETAGRFLHAAAHDARHALGAPCH